MIKRITVRIDEELEKLMAHIKGWELINISAVVREALKKYLINCIDNSSQHVLLEKGKFNNATTKI